MASLWQSFITFMLNIMIYLYQLLGGEFILALIAFTVLTRLAMLPVSLRQQRSSIRMQEKQPQIQAIQKKYRDNPQKMQEEFSKLGYNPAEPLLGCLPLLLQMPIFFALYRVIIILLQGTPMALLELKERTYPGWFSADTLASILPIDNTFLWVNLAQPDPLLVLPLIVAGTMFLQQRLMMPAKKKEDNKGGKKKAAQDDPAAQMQQSMQYTMPIMFGVFAMSFNSGLAIYFIISNIIGIFQGWYIRTNLAEERAQAEIRKEESRRKAAEIEGQKSEEDVSLNGSSESSSKKEPKKESAKSKSSGGGKSSVKSKRKKKGNR